MSIWIRAIVRDSLHDVVPEDLKDALADSDFMMMAENQGLSDEEGAEAERNLRFESEGEAGFAVFLMHYRKDDERSIGIERWVSERFAEEREELLEELEGDDSQEAERVMELLREATESVAFELKLSDAEGLGWPIAFEAAMWLAKRGRGLVEAEGEWWDPESWDLVFSSQ